MIIDTLKVDYDWLCKVASLISDCNLIPDDDGVFNCAKKDWYCHVNYDEVIEDGKSIFKFGDCGKRFKLHGKSNNYKLSDKERKTLKSLKNFPDKCEEFVLNHIIEDIDYLPTAKEYNIRRTRTKRISYPFPENIKSLYLVNTFIGSFNNFPKVIEDTISLIGNKFISTQDFPEVNGVIDFEDVSTIRQISGLKGNFHTLELSNLKRLDSITIPTNKIKTLSIVQCPELKDVYGLENISEDCEVYISNCRKIDPYIILQCKAMIKCSDTFGKFYEFYDVFYRRDEDPSSEFKVINDPRGLTRAEFELKVLDVWSKRNRPRSTRTIKEFKFKTEEANKKREDYLKSLEMVDKYKL